VAVNAWRLACTGEKTRSNRASEFSAASLLWMDARSDTLVPRTRSPSKPAKGMVRPEPALAVREEGVGAGG
jgi:hypothetical protein